MASAGIFRDGSTITGFSSKAGGPGDTGNNPELVSMAKSAPGAQEFAGCCGEIHVLTQALDKGIDVAGGVITSVTASTGALRESCTACTFVMKSMGVSDGARAILDKTGVNEALRDPDRK